MKEGLNSRKRGKRCSLRARGVSSQGFYLLISLLLAAPSHHSSTSNPPPQLPMPMHMPLQLLLSSLGDMPSGAAHLLHTAARAGQHATVAYLLSQGVASKQSAGTGDTPLHAAVLSGDLPTVNTLIEPSKVSGWTVCSAAQNSTQGFVLCRCTLPQHSCTLSSSSNSSSPPAPSPVSSLSPSPPFLFASLSLFGSRRSSTLQTVTGSRPCTLPSWSSEMTWWHRSWLQVLMPR